MPQYTPPAPSLPRALAFEVGLAQAKIGQRIQVDAIPVAKRCLHMRVFLIAVERRWGNIRMCRHRLATCSASTWMRWPILLERVDLEGHAYGKEGAGGVYCGIRRNPRGEQVYVFQSKQDLEKIANVDAAGQ